MPLIHDLLPVSAIALVIISMVSVDLLIIGDPGRALSAVPILLFLMLWATATIKLRRAQA